MRRSKSNPAKYARNYRKISQRCMTGSGSEHQEQEDNARLEATLRQSEQTWRRGLRENGHCVEKKSSDGTSEVTHEEEVDEDNMLSLLSPDLRKQFAGMGGDNLLILPSSKKKKSKKKELPPLTPQEIKTAKAVYKNTQRKLAQLEQRRKQKEVRGKLYKQLEEHTLVQNNPPSGTASENVATEHGTNANTIQTQAAAQSLLLKSSELGKKVTKKQRLKHLRKKEALGIPLTDEEMELLYEKYEAPSADQFEERNGTGTSLIGSGSVPAVDIDVMTVQEKQEGVETETNHKNKKKKKKKRRLKESHGEEGQREGAENETEQVSKKARVNEANPLAKQSIDAESEEFIATDKDLTIAEANHTAATVTTDTIIKPKQQQQSFSELMMANLASLKTKTDTRNTQLAKEQAEKREEEEEQARKLEEEERKRRKVYVPSEIGEISTMHHMLDDDDDRSESKRTNQSTTKVQPVHRPADIEASRYDLPVSAMECEIIDAVRSHDCTILCGETGSGKSTQVPQFLYEAGFSSCESNGTGDGKNHMLIGITQPRRVAAVSTAKRVAYEMGHGSGQSIQKNNLVAYQTRYETAGLGGTDPTKSNTCLKFMTDGILLQEIQSDLLLRNYGAIVIDEAHERNLNTDVLLGLLSVALPLRRKAAEESKGKLPPLKLIIMSATLRVEDFTENTRLFPPGEHCVRPALVKVPGRTYPVSIHHSKVTELDDYEKVAMEKTCKIHRKLPPGGILVFLTGKQEIVRCVHRLRQKLEPRQSKKRSIKGEDSFEGKDVGGSDGAFESGLGDIDGFRDIDDEEVDGDLFQKIDDEEEDDFENLDDNWGIDATPDGDGDDDKRPKKVRILPLYSMLSIDEQAKVFAPVSEDTRLIVVATNIAETSITIPGVSYVVDSGRQKCRNYHASTGVTSYDVMWISKAAADQRAGRAGRTGPGHCYRLFSSSVYSRYLDDFALPEVLSRPLEDVILAMKAMNVTNVTKFPFPTPPEESQVAAAVRLLANLGCVDVSEVEEFGGDGQITQLGQAVAKLPLGVRYGKMLLVAAQANVLDYAIALVAVLSESSPFVFQTGQVYKKEPDEDEETLKGLDDVDRNQTTQHSKNSKRDESMKNKWQHDGGDVLAAVKAVGAYAYAGRGAGGNSEKLACRKFCEENGLNLVVMQRIAKMRAHLCKLAKMRMSHAGGVAAFTGNYAPSMPPPKRAHECLLRQAIASGLLDNIARRAPLGVLSAEFTGIPRSAYICANRRLKEPLFIDNNSTVHSQRPEWVCFDSIVRKTMKKDGSTVATMQRVTPIDPEWLAAICHGSNLMKIGSCPLGTPFPRYFKEKDSIQCAVETKFGGHGWEIPPCFVDMYETIQKDGADKTKKKQSSSAMQDDSFRWFARYLLEGKVLPELEGLADMLNDEPTIITRRKLVKKVMLIVSALSDAGVDSARALRKHWAEKDDKFLFKALKPWVTSDCSENAKQMWIAAVKSNIKAWKNEG